MKENEEAYQHFYELAVSLQHQYRDYEALLHILIKRGCDERSANEIIAELRKTNNLTKRQTGVKIIVFGCMILLVGFILTCACFHFNTPIHMIMYSFTTLGLLTLFVGLFYVFN